MRVPHSSKITATGKHLPARRFFKMNNVPAYQRPYTAVVIWPPYDSEHLACGWPGFLRLFHNLSFPPAGTGFDILPGGAYNGHRPRHGGVAALCLFTSYGAQVRDFFHALATVKRLTVCGRQKAEYSFLWACWNALASKRLLVTAL